MSALKNGALYIRVSTADQTELSPDAQQRLLLDYAKKNGIVIAKEFIFEESVSGRHADRRPKFQEMIALKAGFSPDRRDSGLEIQPVCP